MAGPLEGCKLFSHGFVDRLEAIEMRAHVLDALVAAKTLPREVVG
ncbi:hypothetical protein [Qipengyuania sp.]